jgi:hypothetical protein
VRKTLISVFVALAVVAATAAPSFAQNPPPSDETPRVGVAFMLLKWLDDDYTNKGLGIDFSQPVTLGGNRKFSVVGDLGWGKTDGETDFTLGGGLRFTTPAGSRARVFVQGTVGFIRWSIEDCCDDSAIFFAPGGGVLIPITDKVDVKGQLDYLIPNWDGYDDKLLRILLGVTIRVGR